MDTKNPFAMLMMEDDEDNEFKLKADFEKEDKEELESQTKTLIEEALEFYDKQMDNFE